MRDFQRFLVAQMYERRHLRMTAFSVPNFSNNKINKLFEDKLLSQDPYKPSRHTELISVVKPDIQLGINLTSFDRWLTNEIALLKMSIRKSLNLPLKIP
jgi:hypothetical protein